MWSIGEIKSRGKAALKANYWKSVLVAILCGIVSGGTAAASSSKTSSIDSSALATLSSEELAALLAVLIGGLLVICVFSILLHIFLENPLKVGCYRFFSKNVQSDGNAELGVVGEGFGNYGHTFITLFLTDLFLGLWLCLFLIPGIVKSYSYRMVPYIIKDNPELSATETITKSREMMNGNKWRAFLLDLSFIGWILLGIITCGIGLILWTNPYMYNADAALYNELKDK